MAIIAEDETAGPSADLLLAELSDAPNLRLLERAELQRIVAEQSLFLANSRDLLQAGRLAGADALLFLDHFSRPADEGQPPRDFLGLRLILVGPGVLLHTADYAWPLPDIAEWSSTTARTLGPHLARAGVPEADGLKLSLLSLRSPTDSRESRLLDQELNALLLKRLARETNVFVLERQKLGATLLERELNSEASPFWRGSYLIDGTVNKRGFSTNVITLEGRVLSPAGTFTNVVELSGKRGELPELIDRLVVEILKAADQGSTGSWDPAAEAARFFEEAKWSLRWGLLPEAQSAADAAWALGKQDEATAILRVQAYGRAAQPETGTTYLFPQMRRKTFEKPPRPEALSSGISALSIFLEWSARVPEEKASSDWLNTGLQALHNSSELLHRYYFTAEARVGLEQELAELRALCRDTAAWMARVPAVRAPFFMENSELSFDEINSALEREHLFRTMAEYGALWQERVADALPMHRMLISAPSFGIIRGVYLRNHHIHVPLAGWTWAERKNAFPMWRDFLIEMEKSTNPVVRIEAKILQSAMMSSDEKLHSNIREILRLLGENEEALGKHPSPLQYEYHIGNLINLGSNIVTPERDAVGEEVRMAGDQVLRTIREAQWRNAATRRQHAIAAKLFDGQKRFLQERRTDPREFQNLFPPFGVFPEEQARTLLAMLQEYKTALESSLETTERREQGKIRIALFRVTPLENRLHEMLGTPKPQPNVPTAVAPVTATAAPANRGTTAPRPGPGGSLPVNAGLPPHLQRGPRGPFGNPGRRGPGAMPEQVFVPTPIRTNRLTVKAYQQLPARVLAMTNIVNLRNTSFVPVENKLWLRTRYVEARHETGYRHVQRGLITLFDMERGAEEIIPTGFELPLDPSPFKPMRPDFQVWNGNIYAAGGSELRLYDRASKEWRALPVPLSNEAQLYVMDGRLLVLNAESLLEVEPNGSGVKTLASSRRNPPITPLDAVTNLSAGSLFKSAEGFRIWVPPSLYEFRDDAFSILKTFETFRPGQVPQDPSAFLYVESASRSERNVAYGIGLEDRSPAALFTQLPNWGPLHYKPVQGMNATTNTFWKGLDQFSFNIGSAVFVGDDILMWGSPVGQQLRGGVNRPGSVHPSLELKSYLFYLSKRFKEPVVFTPQMSNGTPSLWEHPKPGHSPPPVFMTKTSEHLVFGNHNRPGLWFVPLEELAKFAENAQLAQPQGGAQ